MQSIMGSGAKPQKVGIFDNLLEITLSLSADRLLKTVLSVMIVITKLQKKWGSRMY